MRLFHIFYNGDVQLHGRWNICRLLACFLCRNFCPEALGWDEGDFLVASYHDTLSVVDVHAFAFCHIHNLECAQPVHLDLAVSIQPIGNGLEKSFRKRVGCFLRCTRLFDVCIYDMLQCQFLQHSFFLMNLFSP